MCAAMTCVNWLPCIVPPGHLAQVSERCLGASQMTAVTVTPQADVTSTHQLVAPFVYSKMSSQSRRVYESHATVQSPDLANDNRKTIGIQLPPHFGLSLAAHTSLTLSAQAMLNESRADYRGMS